MRGVHFMPSIESTHFNTEPSGQRSPDRRRPPPACPSSSPTQRGLSGPGTINIMPDVANDNAGAWPLLPFPDGWYATC